MGTIDPFTVIDGCAPVTTLPPVPQMCTSRWRWLPEPMSIPAMPPTIFPETMISPSVGCFDLTCACVYIASYGPIESANTYGPTFAIFPDEQADIASAPR